MYDIVHIMVCLKNFFSKFIGYLSWKGVVFGRMIFFFFFAFGPVPFPRQLHVHVRGSLSPYL